MIVKYESPALDFAAHIIQEQIPPESRREISKTNEGGCSLPLKSNARISSLNRLPDIHFPVIRYPRYFGLTLGDTDNLCSVGRTLRSAFRARRPRRTRRDAPPAWCHHSITACSSLHFSPLIGISRFSIFFIFHWCLFISH